MLTSGNLIDALAQSGDMFTNLDQHALSDFCDYTTVSVNPTFKNRGLPQRRSELCHFS